MVAFAGAVLETLKWWCHRYPLQNKENKWTFQSDSCVESIIFLNPLGSPWSRNKCMARSWISVGKNMEEKQARAKPPQILCLWRTHAAMLLYPPSDGFSGHSGRAPPADPLAPAGSMSGAFQTCNVGSPRVWRVILSNWNGKAFGKKKMMDDAKHHAETVWIRWSAWC